MEKGQRIDQIVFTNKARCRDCYRCVRVCPVKAIKMENGQATVIEERCIHCGTCVRECPQGAKDYQSSIEKVMTLLSEKKFIAASLAPSYAGFFPEYKAKRIPSVLRELGFSHISETSVGAYISAMKANEVIEKRKDQPLIATACPTVINFIEKYKPEAIAHLIPTPSPMICHAIMIKKLYPEAAVVFIGPCIAKKDEAQRPEFKNIVDAVLTFEELAKIIEDKKIDITMREESGFNIKPCGNSRLYPLEGGFLKTASLDETYLNLQTIAVSGQEEVRSMIDLLVSGKEQVIFEPLFCREGCINGPASGCEDNVYKRKFRLANLAKELETADDNSLDDIMETSYFNESSFAPKPILTDVIVTEDAVRDFLEKTGKSSPEDQLNCGACGYPNCIEKAKAVLSGMAEEEMCVPTMRRAAERKTDKILKFDPNGIVIVDKRLKIISMNPAFKKMFMCSDSLIGKRISYLVDSHPFERLLSEDVDFIEEKREHKNYNLICHQIVFDLPDEDQIIGVFINITNHTLSEEKLEDIRKNTILKAKELLDHQTKMAQELARFLGENSAQGELMLETLMSLVKKDDKKKGDSLWDTYTTK